MTAGLTKAYGDNAVLKGVDLNVPTGSIYALLGSNGAAIGSPSSPRATAWPCLRRRSPILNGSGSVGVPERMVDAERDAWILVAAQMPERMPFYMEMKEQQLDDPRVRDLYRDLTEVTEWDAEDPRLDGAADRLADEFESVPAEAWDSGALPDDLAGLLDAGFLESVPGARRILHRLDERGWTGWTNVRPQGMKR